jgi:hypothetical protein
MGARDVILSHHADSLARTSGVHESGPSPNRSGLLSTYFAPNL